MVRVWEEKMGTLLFLASILLAVLGWAFIIFLVCLISRIVRPKHPPTAELPLAVMSAKCLSYPQARSPSKDGLFLLWSTKSEKGDERP